MNGKQKNTRKARTAAFLAGLLLALPAFPGSAQAADRGAVSELVPSGRAVGVKLFADGVLVVDLRDGASPAKACGLKIAGLSLVSNLAAGISRRTLCHEEVMAASADAKPRMSAFIEDFISRI